MDRALLKQLKHLEKQEKKLLNKKNNSLIKSKTVPVIDKIQEKIPEKLRSNLQTIFFKGFQLVFEKGHKYIEKTYDKDKLQLEFDLNNYKVDKRLRKKHIKKMDKQSKVSNTLNVGFSVVEGSVLGLLGIGLPDIPLLIALLMKTIYQVALSYGYDYKGKEEQIYVLFLICGALTMEDKQKEYNEYIDEVGKKIDQNLPMNIDLEEQIKDTSRILSETMLTAKFIQGFPIIGAVGGLANYAIIKKVGKYASLKYKKRYLLGKIKEIK